MIYEAINILTDANEELSNFTRKIYSYYDKIYIFTIGFALLPRLSETAIEVVSTVTVVLLRLNSGGTFLNLL